MTGEASVESGDDGLKSLLASAASRILFWRGARGWLHLPMVGLSGGRRKEEVRAVRLHALVRKMRPIQISFAPMLRAAPKPLLKARDVRTAAFAAVSAPPRARGGGTRSSFTASSSGKVPFGALSRARLTATIAGAERRSRLASNNRTGLALLRAGTQPVAKTAGPYAVGKRLAQKNLKAKPASLLAATIQSRRPAPLPSLAPMGARVHDVGPPAAKGAKSAMVATGPFDRPAPVAHLSRAEDARAKVVSSSEILPRMQPTGVDHAQPGGREGPALIGQGVSHAGLERALSDFFRRQSRLPPAGVTAFDPRLTPAWPSLKLPG